MNVFPYRKSIRIPEVCFSNMEKTLTITHYHHSGFSCELGQTLFIFDYWTGENGELPEEKRITPETIGQYEQVYVFISHEHPDHYDQAVYGWNTSGNVRYIISYDMPADAMGDRMRPGEINVLPGGVIVRAFDSTDLGVSFLVEADGVRIFHAGDLNFWHWRDESTIKEIAEAEDDYNRALAPILQEKIDVAFFPVDPRQGQMYDAGANTFIMSVKPRLLIPMHFFGRKNIAAEFARHSRTRETNVIALTRFGEQLALDFEENGHVTVRLLTPPEAVPPVKMEPILPVIEPMRGTAEVSLENLAEGDPFSESDLPINMNDE